MSGMGHQDKDGEVILTLDGKNGALRWRGPGKYVFSLGSGRDKVGAVVQISLPAGINSNLRAQAMSAAEDVTKMSSFDSPEERAAKTLEIAEQFYRFLVAA